MGEGFDFAFTRKRGQKGTGGILLTLPWQLHLERLYLHGNNTIV